MLKKIISVFITQPPKELLTTLKDKIKLILSFLKDTFLLKFQPQNSDIIIHELLLIFKSIIIIILFNLTVREVLNNYDSNLIKEIGVELVFAFVYVIFFLINYYHGALFNKILKSDTLTSFSTRLWNFYALLLIIFLQLFGGLSGKLESALNIMLFLALPISLHQFLFYWIQVRKKNFKKNYIFFHIPFTCLILIEIFFITIIANFLGN